MKLYINSKTKDGAWGGGNQFLKALRAQFLHKGVLETQRSHAQVILFNGYQEIFDVIKSWFFERTTKRVYRLGPVMSLHRNGLKWKIIDKMIIVLANMFVDLVIFQSHWSFEQAVKRGFNKQRKFALIPNAVDPEIFYKKNLLSPSKNQKVKLVYTSWSSNIKKGFPLLMFLDHVIDFEKFEFTFIGNSPSAFKNIKILPPLPSEQIAERLRDSDIFISPTKDDACSNAIIEALSCGVPVVALRSGANSELVGNGGVMFNDENDIIDAIKHVAENLEQFQQSIDVRSMDEISNQYINVIKNIL